jgi:hypothetical protein
VAREHAPIAPDELGREPRSSEPHGGGTTPSGLPGLSAFARRLASEGAQAWRQGGTCAICLIEVQGIEPGAPALADTIRVLSQHLAAITGSVYQLADRELALVLPATSQEDAETTAHQLEAAVCNDSAFRAVAFGWRVITLTGQEFEDRVRRGLGDEASNA